MVYSGKGVSRRDFLKGAAYGGGALVLSGCIPVFNSSRNIIVGRIERPVLDSGAVVDTQRSGISLEELLGQLAGQKFRGYATYDGFPGRTGFITIYSQLKNPDELDSQRFGNGYSLSHNPNSRITEGRTALFEPPISGEEIAANLVSKAVLVPVYPDGEIKIVAIPLLNNLGIEDVASGFEGGAPLITYNFSVPMLEGVRRVEEEGIQSPPNEGPGPGDPENPGSPVGEGIF